MRKIVISSFLYIVSFVIAKNQVLVLDGENDNSTMILDECGDLNHDGKISIYDILALVNLNLY